jgi:hypothetical protein
MTVQQAGKRKGSADGKLVQFQSAGFAIDQC